LICKWLGSPRNPAQDLADFQQGVEIRVKAMFPTPDGRVKAKWGELRLSTGQAATWTSQIGNDTFTFPLATTVITPSEKQFLKRTPRFDLTLADGSVQTMSVFVLDGALVSAAFSAPTG